jgi:co-chaperonin GroES (HSP10)
MTEMRGEDGRELHVVGDRVLIAPDESDERTRVGLYLPATAVEGQPVQSGRIVATGPGDPVVDPSAFDSEPWRAGERSPKHRPMQAQVGDQAIFFRKAAVEITFQDRKYLVVPHAAILVLLREGAEPGPTPW